ncbi:MAG TPA: NUDIX hydrolase, partial [Halomonas sp.]|nr:NUDIX hydrolase [Halomonas sp.]
LTAAIRPAIVATHWLTCDEIVAHAAAQRLRSPLVLKRIDDALNHRHFPLSVIQE